MRTSESVAALKKVDFPHDGFPISPSSILNKMILRRFELRTSSFLRRKLFATSVEIAAI